MKIKVGQRYEVGVLKHKCTIVSVDNGDVRFLCDGEKLHYGLTEEGFKSISPYF